MPIIKCPYDAEIGIFLSHVYRLFLYKVELSAKRQTASHVRCILAAF